MVVSRAEKEYYKLYRKCQPGFFSSVCCSTNSSHLFLSPLHHHSFHSLKICFSSLWTVGRVGESKVTTRVKQQSLPQSYLLCKLSCYLHRQHPFPHSMLLLPSFQPHTSFVNASMHYSNLQPDCLKPLLEKRSVEFAEGIVPL